MVDETFEISSASAAALGALMQAVSPHAAEPGPGIPFREPDDTWDLDGGTAWVWRVPGNETLTKPVIIADGFSAGASFLREWAGLWDGSAIPDVFAWGTQLQEAGRDVIVLGYDSRSVAIAANAEVAIQCVKRALEERSGDAPLVLGGLSMGGLVTRYALLKMEHEDNIPHGVGTYFSYDSPHRGAWIPISLQVFAHFMAGLANYLQPSDPPDPAGDAIKKAQLRALSGLLNSSASRELMWKHTASHVTLQLTAVGPNFVADAKRVALLKRLEDWGSWPQGPDKLLAVSNGRGDGVGLDVTAGAPNLVWEPEGSPVGPGATLYAQNDGDNQLVATLVRALSAGTFRVKTSGIPALDGAPGGTLDSFAIAAHSLAAAGFGAEAAFPDVCFVPVASAVDLADPSDPFVPVNDMDANDSALTDYKVASQNEGHTLLTAELCTWLTEKFDE